jgi:hypothetical protein
MTELAGGEERQNSANGINAHQADDRQKSADENHEKLANRINVIEADQHMTEITGFDASDVWEEVESLMEIEGKSLPDNEEAMLDSPISSLSKTSFCHCCNNASNTKMLSP